MHRAARTLASLSVLLSLAAACGSRNLNEHLKKAAAYLERSQVEEAILEYRQALQAAPRRGDIHRQLGEAYLRAGNGDGALREFVLAADLLPNDAGVQVQAGTLLVRANRFDQAKARALAALALDPKNPDHQILLGNALAGLNDIEGAMGEYQEAIALDPGRDTAYVNIGAIQFVRGQRDEAEAMFRKAIEVAPKSVDARMAMANFLWASHRAPEAEQTLKGALALDPANLAANRALGMFYLSSNRAAEAEPYFKMVAATAKTTEAEIGLADFYAATGRFEDASHVLKTLTKKSDAYEVASIRLAAVDSAQGNRANALATLQDVLAKFPRSVSARLLDARLLLADGKRDEALASANTIVAQAPNSPAASDAHLLIGHIQAGLDRTDEAIDAYKEARTGQARPIAANLALAEIYVRTRALDKALTSVNDAQAMDPKNPQARALRVRILLLQGQVARAKEELASLRKEFPDAPAVLNLVAGQQAEEGQFEAARASYMRVAELQPANAEALAGLVGLDLRAKRTNEAIARIEAALKLVEPTGNLLMLAAEAYRVAGDMAKFEDMLKRAIDANPARLQAYSLLGSLYAKQHRLDDARAQFQRVIDREPKSPSANTMLAWLFEAQHRLPEAEQQYQKVLANDTRSAVAANNLAWLYVSSGRNLDQALQLALTAQRQWPEEPHVNDTVGWIYYRKNMASTAVRYLEVSVRKDPSDPTTHYHLGMAYLHDGQTDKAKQELQRALAFNTEFDGSADARRALAQIGGRR